MQNLIGNALKYGAADQPMVHVSAVEKNTEWVVSVHDNGIGIAQENLERVFEMLS